MNYTVEWTKALLYSLRYVKSVCRQIDNAVEKRVELIPGLTAGYDADIDNTLCQTEKIISFIEKKKRTLRLAVMCNNIFENMTAVYKKALLLKFNTKKNYEQIEKLLDCSTRTYFRYIKEALKAFTLIREKLGFSDEYLENLYKNDKWLLRLKLKAEDEEFVKQKIFKVKKNNKLLTA